MSVTANATPGAAPDASSGAPPAGRVRIGVDVGGTFTDVVLVNERGGVHASKSPSNPADPASGVIDAVTVAARRHGYRDLGALLAACGLFVHGATVATNTLLEKKGARVGLLTTRGFRDSLEIRRGIRPNAWDHRAPMPEVLVPRYLRLPVGGRLDATGQELESIVAADVATALATFRAEGVESVAVCLLHSYANPAHEHRVRDLVRAAWPEAWVCCSADVAPVIGEYERSSTAAVNAYIAPRVVPYLRALEERLAALGLARGLLLVQSNGGCISVGELAERPVQIILSGPAAGVAAIRHFGADIGNGKLVSIEVGGTSCDVMLSADGVVAMQEQIEVDGYHLVMPAVDIHTIGAGGGTIAHVDHGGVLHGGPQGAGARPGPAAYGLGGTRPTVTDAQLVLGRLQPGPYAGGAISLDAERARAAIDQHVARPLGLDVHAAAAGILRVVEQNMRHAVERVSVERGQDPRGFTLVAAGGAGPLHGVPVARSLGCHSVYIPRLAGVFCALGMCNADVRHDFQAAWLRDLDDAAGPAAMADACAALRARARAAMAREGFGADAARFQDRLDLRYAGQQWTLCIDIASPAPAAIRAAFETEHRRLYGHAPEQGRIEVVNLRVAAVGLTPRDQHLPAQPGRAAARPERYRPVWLDEVHGTRDTPIYAGAALRPGHELTGPAIVDEATTTLLVGVGDRLRVTASGNYLIELGPGGRKDADA